MIAGLIALTTSAALDLVATTAISAVVTTVATTVVSNALNKGKHRKDD